VGAQPVTWQAKKLAATADLLAAEASLPIGRGIRWCGGAGIQFKFEPQRRQDIVEKIQHGEVRP
jgi:hypothetical protein